MPDNKFDLQIQQLLDGNLLITNLLYKDTFPKVITFVCNNKGTYQDADEIFQDALYQFIIRVKTKGVQIKMSLEAYIFVICKNLWYQELNKRKIEVRNELVFELNGVDEEKETMEQIRNQESWDLYQEKFLELSNNCQQLLKDFFAKVSYDVIIEKFNYSTKNVAFQRIFKCKKKITDLIKQDNRFKLL